MRGDSADWLLAVAQKAGKLESVAGWQAPRVEVGARLALEVFSLWQAGLGTRVELARSLGLRGEGLLRVLRQLAVMERELASLQAEQG